MSCKTMLVHAATAGAMAENSVTTHADPDVVGTADVVVDDEDATGVVVVVGTAVVVGIAVVVVQLVGCHVRKGDGVEVQSAMSPRCVCA